MAALVVLAALTAAYAAVWMFCYNDSIYFPFYRKGNWLLIAVYAIILWFFSKIYGGIRIGYLTKGEIIYSLSLSVFLTDIITYLQICLIGRAIVSPVPILMLFVADVLLITLWTFAASALYTALFPPKRMIVVYGSSLAQSIVEKMSVRTDKYQICTAVEISVGYDEICAKILDYDAVVICDISNELRNKIMKFCFYCSKRAYVVPKISDILLGGAESLTLFDFPILLCRNSGISFEQRVFKRCFDLVLSSFALILTSPIMLITAILIKLEDGGKIFYRQKRCTLDGRIFEILKFRSMVQDAESDGVARLACEGDARITKVGRAIRSLRIDELPQFINILKGDMSVVGPRPERPEISEQYQEKMPEFDFRLKAKAGLTGMAQVLGKYNTTPYDKLKYDLMYIENYSVWLDIKLIFMTIKILFTPSSTEGIEKGKTTPEKKKGRAKHS